jgi:hypothetical protein
MQKELHIWMGEDYPKNDTFLSLAFTDKALEDEHIIINTVQPHVCSTTWIVKGYRIFVHMLDGKTVEMKLGQIGDNPKEIRVAHNLERMLLANCFGLATRDCESQ